LKQLLFKQQESRLLYS